MTGWVYEWCVQAVRVYDGHVCTHVCVCVCVMCVHVCVYMCVGVWCIRVCVVCVCGCVKITDKTVQHTPCRTVPFTGSM